MFYLHFNTETDQTFSLQFDATFITNEQVEDPSNFTDPVPVIITLVKQFSMKIYCILNLNVHTIFCNKNN